jgi:membrane-bound serine protease (ClpP class)
MDVGQIIFSTISNPDVAYLLLILGLFSAVIAVAVPGTGFAEIAAGLCLLLAFIGLSNLPPDYAVNMGGILLIIAGIGMFIVDLKLQSFAFAVGGAVALAIGSAFLIQTTDRQVAVSLWLIGIASLGALVFFGYGLTRAMQAMRLHPKVDVRTVIGTHGVLRSSLLPTNMFTGTALIGSELWTVRSTEALPEGAQVVVDRVDGLILYVSKDGAV